MRNGKKIYYLLILFFLMFIGASNSPLANNLETKSLSGNITLGLRNGVWRLLDEEPIFQTIYIDLNCENDLCESKVYGWSPNYNRDVEHQGEIKVFRKENYWLIEAQLDIRPHPFTMEAQEATYSIEIVPWGDDQLIGSYRGSVNNRFLVGKVNGIIKDSSLEKVSNHQPIEPQEHPRLIFRKDDLDELRSKAKSPVGEAIIARLKDSLKGEIFYDGYWLNGGSHGAGYCFLALLENDPLWAQKGWDVSQNAIALSRSVDGSDKPRVLELSGLVTGIAIAYDLCYPFWDDQMRSHISRWLGNQTIRLAQGGGRGWNNNTISNWNVRARSAAGMAALAIKEEPEEFFPNNQFFRPVNNLDLLLATAQRNVSRYIDTALGDGGFGIEGDAYTAHSVIVMLPFLQGYKNVMGKDMVNPSNARWLIPQSMMRMIPQGDGVITPAYGRHRHGIGGSIFPYGLATLPPEFVPSAHWVWHRYFGLEGDQTFGIGDFSPHEAIYAFVNYQEEIAPKNPQSVLDRVFRDQIRGLYVFRNQWQSSDDIVASIYLNSQPVGGGWLFPEATSFRITGLGVNWAMTAPSEGEAINENIVYLPNVRHWRQSKPLHFISKEDGSGVISMVSQNRSKDGELSYLRSFGVDYSKVSGADGIFAIADVFSGDVNHESFREKQWIMHTENPVTIEENKFTITDPSGAVLQGVFASPDDVKISYQPTAKGGKIVATGGNQFFVVMAIGNRDNFPDVKIINQSGINSTFAVGKQEIRFMGDRLVFADF